MTDLDREFNDMCNGVGVVILGTRYSPGDSMMAAVRSAGERAVGVGGVAGFTQFAAAPPGFLRTPLSHSEFRLKMMEAARKDERRRQGLQP